jgi:hypothetical protein
MLLTAAVVAIIVMGVLAPFETLGWWAGWYGDKLTDKPLPLPSDKPKREHYVVYLTGIGGIAPEEHDAREKVFLERLRIALPEAEIVDDIFPYSSSNRALTGQRFFAWAWRLFANVRGRRFIGYLSFLINFRNLWQVLVSSDDRFGPLYNYSSAELVLAKLAAHGYQKGSGIPITFIGYSGGGQISLGAAPFVKEALQAPTYIISLGGVMSSNEGVLELDSLTHLYGSKDNVQRLGSILFPQRWSFLGYTPWNQARQRGIIHRLFMGPMNHTGRKGYLDDDARIGNETFLDHTVATMQTLIRQHHSTPNSKN